MDVGVVSSPWLPFPSSRKGKIEAKPRGAGPRVSGAFFLDSEASTWAVLETPVASVFLLMMGQKRGWVCSACPELKTPKEPPPHFPKGFQLQQ